ncbi:MAG: hypothetical protein JW798_11445 [Prolixibacteraceae bacterium]|nr:hypothetical protein [Prolixibacteraceae bacterium]
MKTIYYFLTLVIISFLLFSCDDPIPEDEQSSEKYSFTGVVQKGPFRIGGIVTVYELDSLLNPTGVSYISTVTDNLGTYNFKDIELNWAFVSLVADGFYFDETKGEVSEERLTLRAISNLNEPSVKNVNCLTNLEFERIKQLVTIEGKTFDTARQQAQEEILKTFNLESSSYIKSEQLNLAQEGELNSKLLTISSILQNESNVALLSEILSGIALDIKTDGTLNDKDLQQSIVTSAIKCDAITICGNLAELYNGGSIPNFQQYIDKFVNTTSFEPLVTTSIYTVKGRVQKGPFRTGSTVTVSELDESLMPTGLNYYSTVTDNLGNFEVPGVELESDYVEMMADGFYYHENFDIVTSERLVMKAIANLADSSTVNVNIATHLTFDRIKYLYQQEGKTFSEAKEQAQHELLRVFNLDEDVDTPYEYIDITQEGELSSKLFAISVIVQGFKNVAPLSEFLTSLAQDFKTDGTIDNEESQKSLITNALFCNVGGIRENTMDLYKITEFSDFQVYVNTFIENTTFEPYVNLAFTSETSLGKNLLAMPDNSVLSTGINYCINQTFDFDNSYRFLAIIVLEEEGNGNITYIENDITNWIYDDNYSGNFNGKILYGIDLMAMIWEDVSNTPVILNFRNSGKIKLAIYIDNDDLPDNGGHYFIEKYFTW